MKEIIEKMRAVDQIKERIKVLDLEAGEYRAKATTLQIQRDAYLEVLSLFEPGEIERLVSNQPSNEPVLLKDPNLESAREARVVYDPAFVQQHLKGKRFQWEQAIKSLPNQFTVKQLKRLTRMPLGNVRTALRNLNLRGLLKKEGKGSYSKATVDVAGTHSFRGGLAGFKKGARYSWADAWDNIPEQFSLKELRDLTGVSMLRCRAFVSNGAKRGKIESVGNGLYKKVSR